MIWKERGDTLLEVAIALTITAMVLASAFALSGRALRLGRNAKERTQATQLMQEQAEGLRNYRDNYGWALSASSLEDRLVSLGLLNAAACSPGDVGCVTFRMERNSSGEWSLAAGSLTRDIYTLDIVASEGPTADPDQYQFDIFVSWQSAGEGPVNQTNLRTYLVNLDDFRPKDCSVPPC